MTRSHAMPVEDELSRFQEERIVCPFCKDDARGGVEVHLESNGRHSTTYPRTPHKFSVCGGCNDASFKLLSFYFHRCPRCYSIFLEPEEPPEDEEREDRLIQRLMTRDHGLNLSFFHSEIEDDIVVDVKKQQFRDYKKDSRD